MSINFDNFNSVVSLFTHQSKSLSENPYLWKKQGDKFTSISWKDTREQVESISNGVVNLGKEIESLFYQKTDLNGK